MPPGLVKEVLFPHALYKGLCLVQVPVSVLVAREERPFTVRCGEDFLVAAVAVAINLVMFFREERAYTHVAAECPPRRGC